MAKKKAAKKKAARKPAKRKLAAKKKLVKGRAVKKTSKAPRRKLPPAPSPLPWRDALPGEKRIGVIDDFFGHLQVIVLYLQGPLAVGDSIHVRGHTTDLTQRVDSIQIGHQAVSAAKAKDGVGIKVNDKCRKGDYVYRVSAAS